MVSADSLVFEGRWGAPKFRAPTEKPTEKHRGIQEQPIFKTNQKTTAGRIEFRVPGTGLGSIKMLSSSATAVFAAVPHILFISALVCLLVRN